CFFLGKGLHTAFSRDWSADVCSSDLPLLALAAAVQNANAVVIVGPDFASTPVNSSITIDESQLLANDSTDAEEGSVFVGSVSQEDRESVVEGRRVSVGGARMVVCDWV